MDGRTALARRKARVTEQLGEAVYAAIGLMVREYMGAPEVNDEGLDFDLAEEGVEVRTRSAGAEENESFDLARFLELRESARPQETEPESAEDETVRAERAAAGETELSDKREAVEAPETVRVERETAAETIERRAARQSREATAAQEQAREEETPERTEWGTRFGRAETDDGAARSVSAEIERDARRYDGRFYLY